MQKRVQHKPFQISNMYICLLKYLKCIGKLFCSPPFFLVWVQYFLLIYDKVALSKPLLSFRGPGIETSVSRLRPSLCVGDE